MEQVQMRIAHACRRSGRSPDEITMIAVTKSVGTDAIRAAVATGVQNLAENRVQEAEAKRPDLRDFSGDVTWHMVGHLQSNKVKTAILLFDIIHSVDSLPLAEAISRRASSRRPIFLEVNVSTESGKFGFSLDDLPDQYRAIRSLQNIEVLGLMTVAPQTKNAESVRPIFRHLRQAAHSLGLNGLSMGMSDDFEVAVEEGATHLRIGRAIFGERPE
ncbi:MAG TPA: YggS family pyridoxal phosphate-dependent enzyme [Dehalococcoidia bacterium]|nr:YggS family pyridoxal phosphate-dependent enzyme [Dehalococcoidia bacterium]